MPRRAPGPARLSPPRIIRSAALLGGRSRPLPRSHWSRAPVPPRSSRLPARGVAEGAGRDAEEVGAARACGARAAQNGMRVSRGSLLPAGGRRWVRGAGRGRAGHSEAAGRSRAPSRAGLGQGPPAGGARPGRSQRGAASCREKPCLAQVLLLGESSHECSCHGLPHFVTAHWNRLPVEAVESPSLEILQNRLYTILCHVARATLLEQGSWTK